MAAGLLAEHWNATDVDALASGVDAGGRALPSNAWMALRRLGWTIAAPEGLRVNDRIVRMAQEAAGRTLRSAKWRADVTAGVLKTWPAEPGKRTAREWEAVRAAVPGGRDLPSGVITSRTRQIAAFQRKHGRLPVDVSALEAAPHSARMLLLSACDGQQATIARGDDPGGPVPQPGLRLAGRPRHRSMAAHRRPRPDPPDQDHDRPHQRRNGHPQRGRPARSHRPGRTGHRPDPSAGPVQDRTHPAPHHTPRAQATQGTLPHQTHRSGGQASGGTRSHGPEAAAPRSPPAPGRDDDQHTHHQPTPATRSSTGRRIPPARPCFPATMGNDPGNSIRLRIT
jgi:hypothetical protein